MTRLSRPAWTAVACLALPLFQIALPIGWEHRSHSGAAPLCTWAAVPQPAPSGFQLRAVSYAGEGRFWAVGSSGPSSQTGYESTLIERGRDRWRRVAAPSPSRGQGNGVWGAALSGVGSASPSDAWSVGDMARNGQIGRWVTLIERWDGSRWRIVPSPNHGVTMLSDFGLIAVSAASSTQVWAVGAAFPDRGGPGEVEVVLRLHHGAWTLTPWPKSAAQRSGPLPGAVGAISSRDVWAVGSIGSNDLKPHVMIEHFNGHHWRFVHAPDPIPEPGRVTVSALAAKSPGNIWAVGSYATSVLHPRDRTLALHFDGKRWRVVPTPDPGPAGNELTGVAFARNGPVAVGDAGQLSHPRRTIMMGFNGGKWTLIHPLHPKRDFPTALASSPSGRLIAVGARRRHGAVVPLVEKGTNC